MIRAVADNYLRYARRQRHKALTKKYPRDMVLQKSFAELYRQGGAHTCLKWFRYEYDMPLRPEWKQPHMTMKEMLHGDRLTFHQQEAPLIAKEAFEDFDEDILQSSYPPLMKEIESYLRKLSSDADRERYLLLLLAPFRDFANAFCPKSRIQDAEREIQHIANERARWTAELEKAADSSSKEYADAKEQLNTCDKIEQLYRNAIDHYNNVADRLYWYAQHGLTRSCTEEEDPDMCLNLGYRLDIMQLFARELASLALSYGFDLNELQEKSGVYLLPKVMNIDYVDHYYITSHEQVRRLLKEIHERHTVATLPSPTPAKRRNRQKPTEGKTTKTVPPRTIKYTNNGRDRNKRLQAAMVLLEKKEDDREEPPRRLLRPLLGQGTQLQRPLDGYRRHPHLYAEESAGVSVRGEAEWLYGIVALQGAVRHQPQQPLRQDDRRRPQGNLPLHVDTRPRQGTAEEGF